MKYDLIRFESLSTASESSRYDRIQTCATNEIRKLKINKEKVGEKKWSSFRYD